MKSSVWNGGYISILCAALALIPIVVKAQSEMPPPPIEWGNIPIADLEMKSYAPDTAASAVVLCDYGETSMDNEIGLEFTRHRRIKIFSPSGYDWATQTISFYAGNRVQWVRDIEGATYSLGPDGKVVVTELDRSSIFTEDYDQTYKRYRFTLPALQPGCVIEYRYRLISENIGYIQDWTFQRSIPTAWSEYRVRIPTAIAYSIVFQGFEPLYINELKDVVQHFTGESASYLHEGLVKCNQYRWVVKDASALRPEPYVTTLDDYYMKVSLQLRAYATTAGVTSLVNSWEDIIKRFLDDKDFGGMLEPTSGVGALTDEITRGLTTPTDRMKAIYDYVRTRITWSGSMRRYADQDLNDILESKHGTNAEITFLLIAMLRHAGIDADPVALSTRSHGKVMTLYPMIAQLNDIIAVAHVGGTDYFLDATDARRPIELLPPDVLNVKGLLVKPGPAQWVDILPNRQLVHRSAVNLSLGADGAVAGTAEIVDQDYGALLQKDVLRRTKEADYVKLAFDSDRSGLQIDSVSITGKDSSGMPLRLRAHFSSTTYAQASGDNIYVNPTVVDRMVENPFKLAVRKFPVDMNYPRLSSTSVTIEIPEGWEIKEVPPDRNTGVGLDDANYTRTVTVNGRIVHVTKELKISRIEFPQRSYERLRSFYGQMVNWESEQIVLQKIPAKAPAKSPAGRKR